MSLFVIGDLHLSLGEDKPMDVFSGWNDYVQRLENNWRRLITDDDTVVIAGDISRQDTGYQHDGAAGKIKSSAFELQTDPQRTGYGYRDIHDQCFPHHPCAEVHLAVGIAKDHHHYEYCSREHQCSPDSL